MVSPNRDVASAIQDTRPTRPCRRLSSEATTIRSVLKQELGTIDYNGDEGPLSEELLARFGFQKHGIHATRLARLLSCKSA